ncbi:menin [Colias croceus]|uniref:menin n=1 Tax=Colias crocea TaxID=72248 RepID=UPI001E27A852|nr:menin [Colias croceus]
MSGLIEYKSFFPFDSIQKVCELFEEQLRSEKEPDLALFSIIVGAVENNLTNIKANDKDVTLANNKFVKMKFPSVSWEEVKSLYDRFISLMKSGVDAKLLSGEFSSRELVKRVADVVWNSLTRSYYKDRAHLQSIYSFLTGNKLDCFGVAFAVTAACQVLGKNDVHLALSEDHAWVVFGKDGKETAEVTWHGKGNEDKRGRSVGDGVLAHSWLYVAGKPVVCTRVMELAALVSSINPTLTPTIDVHEVALMQHKLLWLLYEKGHLHTYPMALGNLGDLEEYMKLSNCSEEMKNSATKEESTNTKSNTPRPDSAALYLQAIRSSRHHYDDRHVYPYTFQGGYYHRHKMYKEAFHAWACAGDVIRHYNYSRDDEEIYKEFSEIANELIPQLMKAESSGHSARSILKDPECFASLLRFYDGICKWEEGSQTPILHIGWAKPLVSTISKFDAEVRAQVNIVCNTENNHIGDDIKKTEEGENKDSTASNDSWNNASENIEMTVREQLTAAVNSRPRVTLYSHKMAALKPLLLAERLNTHALQLQLTAQSQLQRPQTQRRDDEENSGSVSRAKRARRER